MNGERWKDKVERELADLRREFSALTNRMLPADPAAVRRTSIGVKEIHSEHLASVISINTLDVVDINMTGKHSVFGDFTGLADDETGTVFDVILEVQGTTGGEVHALDVAEGGVGSAEVAAVGTHSGVDPIHQHTGTFAADTAQYYNGSTYADVKAGGAVFTNDDDILYVGADAVFDEINIILSTMASVDCKFDFAYWDGTWNDFSPADDTRGFRQNGLIRFDADILSGWATKAVNSITKYYIQITRTKKMVVTTPVLTSVKVLAATEYSWDKNGIISCAKISPDTGLSLYVPDAEPSQLLLTTGLTADVTWAPIQINSSDTLVSANLMLKIRRTAGTADAGAGVFVRKNGSSQAYSNNNVDNPIQGVLMNLGGSGAAVGKVKSGEFEVALLKNGDNYEFEYAFERGASGTYEISIHQVGVTKEF